MECTLSRIIFHGQGASICECFFWKIVILSRASITFFDMSTLFWGGGGERAGKDREGGGLEGCIMHRVHTSINKWVVGRRSIIGQFTPHKIGKKNKKTLIGTRYYLPTYLLKQSGRYHKIPVEKGEMKKRPGMFPPKPCSHVPLSALPTKLSLLLPSLLLSSLCTAFCFCCCRVSCARPSFLPSMLPSTAAAIHGDY